MCWTSLTEGYSYTLEFWAWIIAISHPRKSFICIIDRMSTCQSCSKWLFSFYEANSFLLFSTSFVNHWLRAFLALWNPEPLIYNFPSKKISHLHVDRLSAWQSISKWLFSFYGANYFLFFSSSSVMLATLVAEGVSYTLEPWACKFAVSLPRKSLICMLINWVHFKVVQRIKKTCAGAAYHKIEFEKMNNFLLECYMLVTQIISY